MIDRLFRVTHPALRHSVGTEAYEVAHELRAAHARLVERLGLYSEYYSDRTIALLRRIAVEYLYEARQLEHGAVMTSLWAVME